MLLNSGLPIVSYAAIGSDSPLTALSPTKHDLDSDAAAQGLLVMTVRTTNGKGETPTSPGSGKKFTLKYAFSDDAGLAAADAPTVLQTKANTLEATLPDSNSSAVAGKREYSSDYIAITGRFLFIWAETEVFAADAKIDAAVIASTI